MREMEKGAVKEMETFVFSLKRNLIPTKWTRSQTQIARKPGNDESGWTEGGFWDATESWQPYNCARTHLHFAPQDVDVAVEVGGSLPTPVYIIAVMAAVMASAPP